MRGEESFLAFDLGGGSIRGLRGILSGGRLEIEELHRSPNRVIGLNGHFFWNIYGLYEEILHALFKVSRAGGTVPLSLGIDTWGLDFGLLSEEGNLLGLPFTYRDPGILGAMEKLFQHLKKERIYSLTGIQFLPFNTIYQLYAIKEREPRVLEAAEDLLFIPDILNYFLSGVKRTEFSFATTSQLFNPRTFSWETELFEKIGVDPGLMQQVVQPGEVIGPLTEKLIELTGLANTQLISVASHDTASAVAAVPAEDENFAYISSGTWSLMGIETREPVITEASRKMDFTNEGGFDGTCRVLKNITGFWLLERVLESFSPQKKYTYDELMERLGRAKPFRTFIDPDHPSFINPSDMVEAIADFAERTGQPIPKNVEECTAAILESLAMKYRFTLEQLKLLSPHPIQRIHIIGGGAQNNILNRMTANATGLEVYAGPVEATSIGNLLIQAASFRAVDGLSGLRAVVRNSFRPKVIFPRETDLWDGMYGRFRQVLEAGAGIR